MVPKATKENRPVDSEEDSEDEDEPRRFEFEGTVYKSYQEMVTAKRKRNEDYLKQNGLWKPMAKIQQTSAAAKREGNGLKKRKISNIKEPALPRRQSNRLRGTAADGRFVEHEGGGNFVIAGSKDSTATTISNSIQTTTTNPSNRARANDGEPLSLEESINLCNPKWIQETSLESAQEFAKETVQCWTSSSKTKRAAKSPTSVASSSVLASTLDKLDQLSVDDEDQVAKVVPERIYSVATHPSKTKLVVAAGDKNGYVGLWDVDGTSDNANARDGVHLFRYHTRPVNALEWSSGGGLLSSSYDGTVRYFDLEKESVEQVFGTDENEDDHYYTQYLCLDPRANQRGQAFFLSTSMGSVMHVDRRTGGKKGGAGVTFHALCSDEGKKLNSVSLHRDGYCLATAGLDRTVKFWDIRKFGSSSNKSSATEYKSAFLGEHNNKLSVNSALFSPSGEYLVTVNQASTLNTYKNAHLQPGGKKKGAIVQPEHVIRHNNNTGRWLTTFIAQWHPEVDIFCVGSMEKPRAMDVFDGATGDHLRAISGDALTAVASRCCFHASTDKLILVGGNSSGRVTVIR